MMSFVRLLLLAHVVNADFLGRKFFFRVNVIEATEIPDVDDGFQNNGDRCYNPGSDVIVRTEIGGRGKLAELKPGFVSVALDGGTSTLDDPWTSNIVNAELGQELRISLLDYNDPDGRQGECAAATKRKYCHSTEIDCADDSSRQEICKVMFGSACIDDGGVDGCPGLIGGVSAQQCYDNQDSCEDVKTAKFNDITGPANPVNGEGSTLCNDANRQPIGFVAFNLPMDVATPSGVSWDPDLLGDRNRAGRVRESALTVVKRLESSEALDPLPSTAGSAVSFTVQFWASKCAVGEFITARGFCQRCAPGFECPTGVTPVACSPGTFKSNLVGTAGCLACPVDSYSDGSASTQCKDCKPGSFAWPEGSASCTLEVKCSEFEDEVSPRVNGTQPVCVQKTGLAFNAAKAGFKSKELYVFVIVFAVIVGLGCILFGFAWARWKQQQAKRREAQLAQDKIDLEQQMKATENLAINPLMLQGDVTPSAPSKPNPELKNLVRGLQKENAQLREELKRYKIADQQAGSGTGRPLSRRIFGKKKEFGQQQAHISGPIAASETEMTPTK